MNNIAAEEGLTRNNPLDFSGKVALITGAAAGMGLATAQAFADAGAAVVLADFKKEAVKATAQKLVAAGHKAIAVHEFLHSFVVRIRLNSAEIRRWPHPGSEVTSGFFLAAKGRPSPSVNNSRSILRQVA
jgi:short subunit dehydrogenase